MMCDTRPTVVFFVSALFSASALAGNSIEDTHTFRLGVHSQDAEIKSVSNVFPFPPIEIDLTDDLGMDDSSESIYVSYRWRFGEKWALSATFQRLELDGSGAAAIDFNFDGTEYSAGTAIDSEFNVDTYLIDLGYSIVRSEKWEVVVGFGLHAFDIETAITGRVELSGDGEVIIGVRSTANADFLAPLPNLRGGVTYMITPKWELRGGIGWLSLEIDNIDGKYLYADIGTEYRITDRFGIGAAYQISEIDVTNDKSDGFDKLDVDFSGPSIYLTYGF